MNIPTQLDLLSILVLLIGANGFWKILELLLERRKHKAEVNHLYSQVNSEIITNWASWSKKLEQRVKDLEGKEDRMRNTIERQKERIHDLEKQVNLLEEQNLSFKEKIEQLKAQLHAD
jgi:predicted RNase H-like nuclease (RuvC/YqgF family)